ncbi:hypothetical protein BC938DRAFT_480192 [Jimgerdemannia flammicorona]|uniref:Zn(2)-C6 fungal-type domain-containing protein n=1 Tax=Jimgerdemannia flammicorona TaxID=994334 RepID=A0A433QXE8_9FUNG|nr:hypothetical protein BC938DRAFT_480192 [Jimgerdemannia flammicorona]
MCEQDFSPGFGDPRSSAADVLHQNSPVDAVPPFLGEYLPADALHPSGYDQCSSPGFESPRNPPADALHPSGYGQCSSPVCKELQHFPVHHRNFLANVLDLPACDQHSSTGIEGLQNPPDTRQLLYDQSYSLDFESIPDVIDAFQPVAYNQSSFLGFEDLHILPNRPEVNGYVTSSLQLAAARQTKSSLAQAGKKRLTHTNRTNSAKQANPSFQWVMNDGQPGKRLRRPTEGGRTKKSCMQCRQSHSKCDGKQPCGSCIERRKHCSYA